jgi:hypothetical protein
VQLDGDAGARRLSQAAGDVDVVLDYLWGQPAATAMTAVVTGRADRGQPLTWIEIGSVAGPAAPVPSAALRAARLQIIGSGRAPSAPATSSPSCPPSPGRSPGEHSTSTRGPFRSPTSSKPGPTPPAPPSASSLSLSPPARDTSGTGGQLWRPVRMKRLRARIWLTIAGLKASPGSPWPGGSGGGTHPD